MKSYGISERHGKATIKAMIYSRRHAAGSV